MTREEKLENALNTAMDALGTYGSHPIIEMQASDALHKEDEESEIEDDTENSFKPWNWRNDEFEEHEFTSHASIHGVCGLCGKMDCNGNCFK